MYTKQKHPHCMNLVIFDHHKPKLLIYKHDEDSRMKTIQKPTLNVNDLHELCIVLVLWRCSIKLYIYIGPWLARWIASICLQLFFV